jgi:hypothetical protein
VLDAGTERPSCAGDADLNQVLPGRAHVFVVLVSGIYLAAQPQMYSSGVLLLARTPAAPLPRGPRAPGFTPALVDDRPARPMAVIGTLTAIGLK